jgi:hypothetical protein
MQMLVTFTRQMPRYYLQLRHYISLPHLFQFNIHSHPIIRRYITRPTDSVPKQMHMWYTISWFVTGKLSIDWIMGRRGEADRKLSLNIVDGMNGYHLIQILCCSILSIF